MVDGGLDCGGVPVEQRFDAVDGKSGGKGAADELEAFNVVFGVEAVAIGGAGGGEQAGLFIESKRFRVNAGKGGKLGPLVGGRRRGRIVPHMVRISRARERVN